MKLTITTLRKLVWLKQKSKQFFNKADVFFEDTNEEMASLSLNLLDSMKKQKHEIEDGFGEISSVFRRKNRGLTINGYLNLTKDQDRKGVLVSGSTGSGKSVKLCLPILFNIDKESMLCIHDPSKEIFGYTAGYLQSLGYSILILDFANANNSSRFNPLFRLQTKAQFNAFAYTLISNTVKGKMDFWNSKAVSILVFLIELQKGLPKVYDTLYNLYHLVEKLQSETERESFDKLVVELSEHKPELFTTYSSIVSMSENTLSGVLSTLSNALSIYGLDENLAKITSHDTLGDLTKIRQTKTAVFVHSSTTKMEYYSPISTMFFTQFFDAFFQELPTEKDRDTYFILDETPVLKIDNLDIITSNIRKYNGSLCLFAQNPHSQFTTTFSKEKSDTIISNLNTHVYLSIDLKEATHLEKVLGTYTYTPKESEQKITRPLKTKTELMALSSQDKGIVTITGKRPLLLSFTPFYKIPSMVRKSKIPFKRKTKVKNGIYDKSSKIKHLSIEDYLAECFTQKQSSDGQN
ncbi:MAG: type IV secretory system conjugative DNA transfer family protein [Flavobacteriales bacterium]|jgi:type IV secretion system protein VirD4|nr:type IV secretory system conjugative DNA transfer family protein [Flavobacteriales bacterium]